MSMLLCINRINYLIYLSDIIKNFNKFYGNYNDSPIPETHILNKQLNFGLLFVYYIYV